MIERLTKTKIIAEQMIQFSKGKLIACRPWGKSYFNKTTIVVSKGSTELTVYVDDIKEVIDGKGNKLDEELKDEQH